MVCDDNTLDALKKKIKFSIDCQVLFHSDSFIEKVYTCKERSKCNA